MIDAVRPCAGRLYADRRRVSSNARRLCRDDAEVDGVISKGEYSDATGSRVSRAGSPSSLPPKTRKISPSPGMSKHDGKYLYFAFDVTDDVLYGIDTERWLPDNNPRAHEISRVGFPWFGDEMEMLLNASNKWKGDENAAGNGFSWQMVCNLTKSQLHDTNVGGILAGEPRRSADAWNTYVRWIENGDQTCAVKPRKGGYVLEWRIAFNPCLEVEPGVFYSPTMGDKPMGLNIALGDLDEKEKGRRQLRQLPSRRLVGRSEGQAHATATLGNVMDEIRQTPKSPQRPTSRWRASSN